MGHCFLVFNYQESCLINFHNYIFHCLRLKVIFYFLFYENYFVGVFHETRRLMLPIEAPTIDRKPNYSRSSMAEHLLEGLVNSQSGGDTGVRVIIPPISMHQDRDNNHSHQQSLQQQVFFYFNTINLFFSKTWYVKKLNKSLINLQLIMLLVNSASKNLIVLESYLTNSMLWLISYAVIKIMVLSPLWI